MVFLFPGLLPLSFRTRGGACPHPRPPIPIRTPPSPTARGRSRRAGNDGAPEPAEPSEASGFPPPPDDEDDSAAYLAELMAAAAAGDELTTEDISQAGFGEDGTAHQLIPGPVLAT